MSGPTLANHNDSCAAMHAAYYAWTAVWMSELTSVLTRRTVVGDTAGSVVVG
jgi:hypothetical protein